ncbi:MAG TPA: FKBP-type peptidyl-prolyl cis-trans isomerase [Burkholderiaceae bacterium]|jgi:FKBP-type peptidyl-prolyl cis-trans isomerase FkpA|nr:FKBP-type peptidyl-prolyl cis-trans isomerase [Burkholderiaceae bacterium]
MKKTLKLIASIILVVSVAACGGGGSSSTSSTSSWATTSGSSAVTTLQVTDNVVGTGTPVVAGDTLTVNYTGWLYQTGDANSEGAEFDSTAGGSPFSFVVGEGNVIAGWDQGLIGMQAGGTRTLIIPSSLAYGTNGYGAIPGGAALVFTVQLASVTPPAQ